MSDEARLIPTTLRPLLLDPSPREVDRWIQALGGYLDHLKDRPDKDAVMGLGEDFRLAFDKVSQPRTDMGFRILLVLVYLLCTPAATVRLDPRTDGAFLVEFNRVLGEWLTGRDKRGLEFHTVAEEAHTIAFALRMCTRYREHYYVPPGCRPP